jgi:hypothetical protein
VDGFMAVAINDYNVVRLEKGPEHDTVRRGGAVCNVVRILRSEDLATPPLSLS